MKIKIVCVDIDIHEWFKDSNNFGRITGLKLGETYTILDYYYNEKYKNKYLFLEEISYHFSFNSIRFKRLIDIRKEKLNKLLCLKKEIK